MGISESEFWDMSPRKLQIRQKAYEMQKENRSNEIAYEAWLNGYFMTHAIMATIGNVFKGKGKKAYEYPKNPLVTKEEQKNELTVEQRVNQFRLFFSQFEHLKKKE